MNSLGDVLEKLSARHRALVAVAVLLDGVDAGIFLEQDSSYGLELRAAADTLARQPVEVRLPLVATLLRCAVEEIS